MPDGTKLLTAKDTFSEATDAAVRLATKDAMTYDGFRATIRTSIQYLIDHGKVKRSAAAHVLEEEQAKDSQSGVSHSWTAGECRFHQGILVDRVNPRWLTLLR